MKPIDDALLADAVAYADEWLRYRQRTLRVPGIQVAIAHGDRVLLSRAYGVADLAQGTPLTTEHRFRIASHSKMFTATALLLLQERGALALDDRVGRWLDWLPAGEGELGRVTLRQLVSHAAGVIRDGVDNGFWQLERPFPDEARFRSLLERASVVYAPNVRFKYSNFGFTLLGLVVERVSGVPYNTFVREQVVEALGLAGTGPEPEDEVWDLLARGHSDQNYGRDRVVLPHADTHAMSAATGFYATAEDLCRFGRAHFLGNRALLSDESKREMQHEQWHIEGEERGYGLGMVTYEIGGRRLVGHTGGFPGFITSTMFDTEHQLVVTVLTNASDGPASDLSAGVVRLVNRAQQATPATSGSAPLSRFTGRFFGYGREVDVARFGGELVAIDPEGVNPLEPKTTLAVLGQDSLRIIEAPGFASPGEEVRYEFAAGGEASAIWWAGGRLLPEAAFEAQRASRFPATR
ncbi:MAG: serine hydrolase domain-containing protein [Candidatus Dormiibacterota bacterium]